MMSPVCARSIPSSHRRNGRTTSALYSSISLKDSLSYLYEAEMEVSAPTLFDLMDSAVWTSITQNPDSTAKNSLHAGASPCTNAGNTKADWMNAGDVRLYTVKPRRLPVRKPEERFVRIADVPFRSTGFITGLSDVGIRNTDVSPPGARCVWVKSQRKEIVIINLKIQWKT